MKLNSREANASYSRLPHGGESGEVSGPHLDAHQLASPHERHRDDQSGNDHENCNDGDVSVFLVGGHRLPFFAASMVNGSGSHLETPRLTTSLYRTAA